MRVLTTMNEALLERISRAKKLDDVAKPASESVARATAPRRIKNLLSGTWLGHQLHPVLTDLPIGAWAAAAALDLTAGEQGAPAARKLVGLGILASGSTALAGASD